MSSLHLATYRHFVRRRRPLLSPHSSMSTLDFTSNLIHLTLSPAFELAPGFDFGAAIHLEPKILIIFPFNAVSGLSTIVFRLLELRSTFRA